MDLSQRKCEADDGNCIVLRFMISTFHQTLVIQVGEMRKISMHAKDNKCAQIFSRETLRDEIIWAS
jgi:hypothetical protein